MDAQLLSELSAELKAFFAARSSVDAAAIFGSEAQGSDTPQSDVDIMVIGDVSELRINADIAPLGRKYCRQINVGV